MHKAGGKTSAEWSTRPGSRDCCNIFPQGLATASGEVIGIPCRAGVPGFWPVRKSKLYVGEVVAQSEVVRTASSTEPSAVAPDARVNFGVKRIAEPVRVHGCCNRSFL